MRVPVSDAVALSFGDRTELTLEEYHALVRGETVFIPLADESPAAWMTSEKKFQQKVVKYAVEHGWDDPKPYHTFDSASSEPGFCDLVMVRVGADGVGRLVIAELKVEGGRVTKAQRRWLESLATARGVEVFLWYPDDWSTIEEVLR